MARSHSMYDFGKRIRFQAKEKDNDVHLMLSRTAEKGNEVPLRFSKMCVVSTDRPWKLLPQKLKSVSLTGASGSLQIIGRSECFETSLAFSFRGRLLQVCSRWLCTSPVHVENASVAIALELHCDSDTERVTMPHILYNDNPSADPKRLVPHFGKHLGACLVSEETRFPTPCVNVEWIQNSTPLSVTFYSVPGNDEIDWSLGCVRIENGIQIIGASGILAFNGKKDETYGAQNRSVPLASGYHCMKEGDVFQKTYLVGLEKAEGIGRGFRSIASSGYEILRPSVAPCLPIDRVIELKANALCNRWHSDANSSGFLCVLPGSVYHQPPYYLFGWTGQNLRLAWCSAKLGIDQGDAELVDRCRKTVDFYVKNSGAEARGLRYNRYFLDEGSWQGLQGDNISSRAYGEATAHLGEIVSLFRASGAGVLADWIDALCASADFLLAPSSLIEGGVFPVVWSPDGSPASTAVTAAGISGVLGILEAYRITGGRCYFDGAVSILERYWRIFGDRFDRPFPGATLDARCEDKEAGIYFFLAAYELYLLTEAARFREWAEVTADWLLTFVYFWHTEFRPDSICADRGFVTTGWPGVSVQNHHLDVFFPAYELSDFGRRTANARYEHLGRMVFDAWSHGICRTPGDWEHDIPGEQGEQFFQTNYVQGPFSSDSWRGGYNCWNPSWIIALVLEAALKFNDMRL